MSKIADLLIKIGADTKDLKNGLAGAQKDIQNAFKTNPVNELTGALTGTAESVTGLIGKFNALAALAAGGFGLFSVIQGAVSAGDAVYKLSERLGVSTSEAGKFSKVLKATGADVGMASTAIARFDKELLSNSKSSEKARAVLDAVGISLFDQNGKLLPLNEQLQQLAKGYKVATKAGQGQEFIMNTLGARGMSLVSTLQDYDEALNRVSKVKGVGMDPAEAHRVAEELKVVQMQASALGGAFGAMLAPVVTEYLPPLISGLTTTGSYLRENKEAISGITKGLIEFIALYKGFIALKNVSSSMGSILGNLGLEEKVTESAAAEAEITRNQAKQIEQRVRAVQSQALREEKAYMRTLEKSNLTEAEKTAKYIAYANERARAVAQTEAQIRASMTATFTQINTMTAESTAKQIASNTAVTGTAVAGSAKTKAAKVLEKNAVEQVTKSVATHGGVLTSVVDKGVSGVGRLTNAVVALAGGWEMVALAAGVALWEMSKYEAAKDKKASENLVNYNGKKYGMTEDGTLKQFIGSDGYAQPVNNMSASDREAIKSQIENKRKASEESKKAEESAKLEKETSEQMRKLNDMMSSLGGGVDSNTQATKANTEKLYQEEKPIGDTVLELANSHSEGEQWVGKLTSDVRNQCASFVSALYAQAGIKGLYSASGHDLDSSFKNKGAWHDANSGYIANAGDYISWAGHVGISDGQGGYVARNSKGGVHHGSMAEAEKQFGAVQGYGSIGEYTGGATSKISVNAQQRELMESQKRLAQAKDEALRLYSTMASEISKETDSAYSIGMDEIAKNVQARQQEIAKLQAEGVPEEAIKKLTNELADYQEVMQARVDKKRKESLDSLVASTKKTNAELRGDYKALADAEYEATINSLNKQREEKEKEVEKNKGDLEAMAAVERWYTAQVEEAAEARAKAYREAAEQRIKYLIDIHKGAELGSYLGSDEFKDYMDWQGQTKAYQEYKALVEAGCESQKSQLADVAQASQSAFQDFFQSVLDGSSDFGDAVLNLFGSITDSILEQFTEKWSAQITGSLFSGLLGGGGGSGDSGSRDEGAGLFGGITKSLGFFDTKLGSATEAVGLMSGATSKGSALQLAYNGVQSMLNTGTKPAEASVTLKTTEALISLKFAAAAAARELASVGGGGLFGIFGKALGHATGGYISGAGTSTSDSIPAMLSNGEYVINAKAVERIGLPLLNAINTGGVPHFANGGSVGGGAYSSITIKPNNDSVHFHINALDAESFEGYLNRQGGAVLRQHARDVMREFKERSDSW